MDPHSEAPTRIPELTSASCRDVGGRFRESGGWVRLAGPCLAIWTLVATTAGCSQPEDLREWRPDDHSQESIAAPVSSDGTAAAQPATRPNNDDEVIDVWRVRCARCHGLTGRGDGPEGPMFHAPNLTRPEWQSRTTDAALRQLISQGRGRMPPTQLSKPMLDAMVRLVRSLAGEQSSPGTLPPGHPAVDSMPPASPAAPTAHPSSASSAAPARSGDPHPAASAR